MFLLLFQVSGLYRKVQGIGGLHFHRVASKSMARRAKTSQNYVDYTRFPAKRKFSPQRPPGQLQARLTQVSYREFLGAPHCLVKSTVALQFNDSFKIQNLLGGYFGLFQLAGPRICTPLSGNEAHRCPAPSYIAQTPGKGAKTQKITKILSISKSVKI